jgi:hypothetical protein
MALLAALTCKHAVAGPSSGVVPASSVPLLTLREDDEAHARAINCSRQTSKTVKYTYTEHLHVMCMQVWQAVI